MKGTKEVGAWAGGRAIIKIKALQGVSYLAAVSRGAFASVLFLFDSRNATQIKTTIKLRVKFFYYLT